MTDPRPIAEALAEPDASDTVLLLGVIPWPVCGIPRMRIVGVDLCEKCEQPLAKNVCHVDQGLDRRICSSCATADVARKR